MTGRSNRSRENVLSIDKTASHRPYAYSIPSGISVQELKNITALRMAQQQDRWSAPKQGLTYSIASPPVDLYYTLDYPRPKQNFAHPEIRISPESFPMSESHGNVHAHGIGHEPPVCIPSGVSVQELKELTKIRLAREANSSEGEGSPLYCEREAEFFPVSMCGSVKAQDKQYENSLNSSGYNSSRNSSCNDIPLMFDSNDDDQFTVDNIPEQVAEFVLDTDATEPVMPTHSLFSRSAVEMDPYTH